jgi:hypothetical protein
MTTSLSTLDDRMAGATAPHHPRRSRLRIAGLAIAALTAVTTVAGIGVSPTQVSAATYTVTGAYGANARTGPTVSSAVVRVLPRGTAINIVCQTVGDRFGSGAYPDNRTWDKLSDGTFVHDNLTSTPGGQRENLASGGYAFWTPAIPRCGSSTPPPTTPPPPSGSSVMQSQGGRYDCTNMTLPGCAARGTITAGTPLTMHCWIDDSVATGAYQSARWFYVSTSAGVRGFVHSSRVGRQVSVPHCSQHRGISAARWASMKIGSLRPTTAEKGANPSMDRWSGWCYVFAFDAYKFSTGALPKSGLGSAKNTFYAYRNEGKVRTDVNHNGINIGSMVFWTFGKDGHAAIYVGQGNVVTTQGYSNDLKPIAVVPMSSFGTPDGWVAPSNI